MILLVVSMWVCCMILLVVSILAGCMTLVVGCMLSVDMSRLDGGHLGKICKTQQVLVCMNLLTVICKLIVSFVCLFVSWVVSMQMVGSLPCTDHSMGCIHSAGCTG